jgi:putative transposase
MPKTYCAAPELASLLDGSSAGELIPELARHGLQQLIELELAAFLGADWHERTEERLVSPQRLSEPHPHHPGG